MSKIKNLVLMSLALTASSLQAEPHCPGNIASLSLRLVQGSVIVVSVKINQSNSPYDFVVDTGAQITTIDSSLATELHLKAQGQTEVSGVATSARTAFAYLDLLQAGTSSVPNPLVVIQDLTQLKAADPRIRGILGENFLAHFDLLLNNRQHIMCLADSDVLALAVKGERIDLAEPKGAREDLPFTRPIVVSARLSDSDAAPLLLRLDSGSNAPVLYTATEGISRTSASKRMLLKRVVNGSEQVFAILPPQDIQLGSQFVRQIAFVMPMNSIGKQAVRREDGLLPTMAFQLVFISYRHGFAAVYLW